MVVFVLSSGSTSRIDKAVEVRHNSHSLICVGEHGEELASMEDSHILGYTFDEEYAEALLDLALKHLAVKH